MPFPDEVCFYFFIKNKLDSNLNRVIVIYNYKFENDVDIIINKIKDTLNNNQIIIENCRETRAYPNLWFWYYNKSNRNKEVYRNILLTSNIDWFNSNLIIYIYKNNKLCLINPNNSSWRI